MADIYLDKKLTVGELINLLSQLDSTIPVLIESDGGDEYRIEAIYDYSDSKNKRIVISVDH